LRSYGRYIEIVHRNTAGHLVLFLLSTLAVNIKNTTWRFTSHKLYPDYHADNRHMRSYYLYCCNISPATISSLIWCIIVSYISIWSWNIMSIHVIYVTFKWYHEVCHYHFLHSPCVHSLRATSIFQILDATRPLFFQKIIPINDTPSIFIGLSFIYIYTLICEICAKMWFLWDDLIP
jgi:hypothetical protein